MDADGDDEAPADRQNAQRDGQRIRPWAITIIGTIVLIDAAINMLGWGVDLSPMHDTQLG